MKNYTIKNLISVICFIISTFVFAFSIVCLTEWETVFYTVVCVFMSIAYCIVGIAFKKDANEDYEYYLSQHESIKEIYEELSHMHKKYYWILDIDSTIPALKNKKDLLKWSTDVGLACLIYQHDYKTAKNDKQINQDLNIMINLIQELIDHKKYI